MLSGSVIVMGLERGFGAALPFESVPCTKYHVPNSFGFAVGLQGIFVPHRLGGGGGGGGSTVLSHSRHKQLWNIR